MANKEYDYLVTLKKNTEQIANLISMTLLVMALGVFLFVGVKLISTAFMRIAIAAFVVSAFIIFWCIRNYSSKKNRHYRLPLFAAGLCFFLLQMGLWWAGILYILAALLEKQAKFPQEIGFDNEGLTVNSIPVRHITWSELSNVVIRDNLLTVDFKNNKLYQKEIQNSVSKELEQEFNLFCKTNLTDKSSK